MGLQEGNEALEMGVVGHKVSQWHFSSDKGSTCVFIFPGSLPQDCASCFPDAVCTLCERTLREGDKERNVFFKSNMAYPSLIMFFFIFRLVS